MKPPAVNESKLDFQRRSDGLITSTIRLIGWTADDTAAAFRALGFDENVMRGLELVSRPRVMDGSQGTDA